MFGGGEEERLALHSWGRAFQASRGRRRRGGKEALTDLELPLSLSLAWRERERADGASLERGGGGGGRISQADDD